VDRDSAGEKFEFDPAMAEIRGAYASAMNAYVRGDLAFNQDVPYEVSRPLYMTWGWSEFSNRYLAVSEVLRQAMVTNPRMRVLVASGYYDLATPPSPPDFTPSTNLGPGRGGHCGEQPRALVLRSGAQDVTPTSRRVLRKLPTHLRRFCDVLNGGVTAERGSRACFAMRLPQMRCGLDQKGDWLPVINFPKPCPTIPPCAARAAERCSKTRPAARPC
jgi:hypothetical protein